MTQGKADSLRVGAGLQEDQKQECGGGLSMGKGLELGYKNSWVRRFEELLG